MTYFCDGIQEIAKKVVLFKQIKIKSGRSYYTKYPSTIWGRFSMICLFYAKGGAKKHDYIGNLFVKEEVVSVA